MSLGIRERLTTSFLVALFFSLTLLFFGPGHLYYTNLVDFSFTSLVLFHFLLISISCVILLTIILFFLKPSVYQKTVSFLCVLSFLLWLQGNVFLWNYGVLDGREINWNSYQLYGLIDGIVWLLFLILAFVKSALIYRIARKVSLAFLIIQLVSLFTVIIHAPAEPVAKFYRQDFKSQFNFSKEKNVIILVLDSFQSDVFQEIIDEDIHYRSIFKGFTYFRNTVGGFPSTYPSIPLILTGRYYDNSIPIQQFIKEAYTSDSIPYILKKHNYLVDLPQDCTIYLNEDVASNFIKKGPELFLPLDQLSSFFKISLFRCVPHFLKMHIDISGVPQKLSFDFKKKSSYSDNDLSDDPDLNINDDLKNYPKDGPYGFVNSDIEFIKNLILKAESKSRQYTFKFYLLRGVHPPFRINEQLKYEKLPLNRYGYKQQAKAILKISAMFLEQLRKIGIYDQSMVFVISDHGYYGHFGVKTLDHEQGANKIDISNGFGQGIPLVLAKPFFSNGEMNISDAPISLSDLAATIFSKLEFKENISGISIFDQKDSDIRQRRYLRYSWQHEFWGRKYLPVMHEYVVTGFSWSTKSWEPTYRYFYPGSIKYHPPPVYQYGTNIDFSAEKNLILYQKEGYRKEGWSAAEKDFTWTNGKKATLIIPVTPAKTNVILKAKLFPFLVYRKLDNQMVEVYINETKLGKWDITRPNVQEYSLTIPKSFLTQSPLKINFKIPNARSPASLKFSEDDRILGIAMVSMALLEEAVYQYGSIIDFREGGNIILYQREGWSDAEKDFTWIDGKSATVFIPIAKTNTDIILKATLLPFLVPGKLDNQEVDIYVNDAKIGAWKINQPGLREYSVVIPKNLLAAPQLKINFRIPNAIAPLRLGYNTDPRILGIAVQSMVLLNK
jgi:hypothetical protein